MLKENELNIKERERERWDGMSLACFSGDCRKRREEGREENER